MLGATDLKPSTRKNKKYMVLYKNRWIHFGAKGMSDFTIHNDEKRRKSYLARASGIRDGRGKLTYNDKNKANFWAIKILWDG